MNARLEYLRQWFREGIVRVWRRYPVEMLLLLFICVGCIVSYERDDDFLMPRVTLAALFFVLALAVNNLTGQGVWRKLYWVCWLPVVPLSLLDGLEAWRGTPSFIITYLALAPLAVLMCRRAVNNDRFVGDAVAWLRAGALAMLFANVALGLFCAILYSTAYIFGIEGAWTGHVAFYAVIFCETLVAPVLMLIMADRWLGAECRGSRIVDVLLNYIITPALLIYTAILGLYILKILVVWELPRGGVAYLVFGFTLLALGVKALQCLLQKHLYNWFFDRFSLVALPTQVLFWIGTLQRTNEYGLTEERVYLLVCGGLMTLCVLLFLSKRAERYLYVALAAFLSFAALAWIPSLDPQRIALCSQVSRVERAAQRLDLLNENGSLRLDRLSGADTAQYADWRQLYESLDYIDGRDSAAFARFGLADISDFSGQLPANMRGRVMYGWESGVEMADNESEFIRLDVPSDGRRVEVGSCKTLYTSFTYYGDENYGYRLRNDTLRILFGGRHPEFMVPIAGLLTTQLQKIGSGDTTPEISMLRDNSEQMLSYTTDEMLILFSYMEFCRRDSTLMLTDLGVDAVLIK